MRRAGMRGPAACLAYLLLCQAAAAAASPGDAPRSLGIGPAYDQLGRIAVMHEGRIKPLDTLAREEVKHVFSRETVRLQDATNKTVETWGAVGAFVDWMTRPDYWEDQPFILVDYLPLKRVILSDSIKTRLKEIAAKSATQPDDRARLERLAGEPEPTAEQLSDLLRTSKLAEDDRRSVAELAAKLGEDHKWLTPRELDDAKITRDGHTHGFMEWVGELDERKRKFDMNPLSAERLVEVERRAIDVGRRLFTFRSYTSDELRSAGIVRIMPRPSNTKALGYIGRAVKKAREVKDMRELGAIEFDGLKALDTFWNDTPRDERHEPGQDAKFDEQFATWLRESSVWVPLKVFLKSKPEELVEAGFPEEPVKSFLSAYREFEKAEAASPGQLSQSTSTLLLSTSRELGNALNPARYPAAEAVEREAHFNAFNPFWQAPYAYGLALALFAVSLGFVPGRRNVVGILGRGMYHVGMLSLLAGIVLECYGFYLRIRISGWAPVTNMYETVIWVALVTAALAFVFELIYRKTFTALAGSFVALLGTITAANVPLLDPSIKSLVPVLRSNFWLTIHVLTEVSSYAAFGLAWGLGLIALAYYLTATYRRSPGFGELALPLLPGLPALAVGSAGVAASYGVFGSQWTTGDPLFYAFATLAGVGGVLSLGTVLAMAGELVNRLQFRDGAVSSDVSGAGVAASDPLPGSPEHDEIQRTTLGDQAGGAAPHHARPTVAELRARAAATKLTLDARGLAMQQTAATIKPLTNFIYRAMQVGVLLIAAGTILGGVWADYSWGRFWGWDPKEVWALITLLVYLVPLHGRFAGWVNTFGLTVASVVCFLSVVMAWYGVNFVLGVGLHSYGFVDGGSQGMMSMIIGAVMAIPAGAAWRRSLGNRSRSAT